MELGSKWYNNGVINKSFKEGEQPEGWVKGLVPLPPEKIKEVTKKREETCLKKYGVKNPSLSPEIHQKKIDTSMKRFGTPYPAQSQSEKDRVAEKNMKKYGVKTPALLKSTKEKQKQTNLERYGVENPAQVKEFQDKAKQTSLERYGVDNPSKSEEIKEKIHSVCQEKYGYDWPCQRPEARVSSSNNSKPNKDFEVLLSSYGLMFEREFHINSYSYDFKVGNTLIEINPSVTHNLLWNPFGREGTPYDYHQKKSNMAIQNGYHCIHIFDWDSQDKIIKELLLSKISIYARNTTVWSVTKDEVKAFEEEHHLQGYCNGQTVCLGLRTKTGELVSLMTLGKPRYNKNYEYELLRYCYSMQVVGGSEKLFNYFVNNYQPKSVISYCDMSKFSGNVYQKLGFILKEMGKPSKHWYGLNDGKHITDNLLRQRGYDQLFNEHYGKGISNEELIIQRNYLPVSDCGQSTYIWNKE